MNVTRGISGASSLLSSCIDWGLKGCKTVGRVVFWSVPQNVYGRFLVRSVRWLTGAVGALFITVVFLDAMTQKRRQEQKVTGPLDNRTLPPKDFFNPRLNYIQARVAYEIVWHLIHGGRPDYEHILDRAKQRLVPSEGWLPWSQRVLRENQRRAELVCINGCLKDTSQRAFIDFSLFRQKLCSHFKDEEALPVVIDNGRLVCLIANASEEKEGLNLDIKEVFLDRDGNISDRSYTILLDSNGALLSQEGNYWSTGDFSPGSPWSALFTERHRLLVGRDD